METVRLAIIGGGVIGRRHANAISMLNNTKLAAICDPGPSGRQLAEDMGVPLHLNTRTIFTEDNIDGVIVSTPTENHFRPTLEALDAGCHVLVEKPMTATLNEADQIIRKASENSHHVLVGHHRRYYSLVQKNRNHLNLLLKVSKLKYLLQVKVLPQKNYLSMKALDPNLY